MRRSEAARPAQGAEDRLIRGEEAAEHEVDDQFRQGMAETELFYGDPEGYCFHHFYPFTCEE